MSELRRLQRRVEELDDEVVRWREAYKDLVLVLEAVRRRRRVPVTS